MTADATIVRAEAAAAQEQRRLTAQGYLACFNGIVWREVLRFLHQRERFFSALVRPLIWLFIFGAGFRNTLGVSIIPPYETYQLYEVFITPGLIGMILLFNAMQSSLSMVYDRETGAMRTLLVSPFPRSFLLLSKLLGGVSVALLQVFAFIAIGHLFFRAVYFLSGIDFTWDIHPPAITDLRVSLSVVPPAMLDGIVPTIADPIMTKVASVPTWLQAYVGYVTLVPALVLSGLMLGSLALFMSSVIKQLENFAGVMNFVIFPMFFASSALYPLWRIREASPPLFEICRLNPFTYAVELIRFALHGQLDVVSLIIVAGCTILFLGAAVYAYNPSKGLLARRGGPAGGA